MIRRMIYAPLFVLAATATNGCASVNAPSAESAGGACPGADQCDYTSTSGEGGGHGTPTSSSTSASEADAGAPGAWQGTIQLGTTADEEGIGLGIDGAGFLYLVGNTRGQIIGSPGEPQESDVFIMKMEPSGAVQWAARLGSPGPDEAAGIAVSPSGTAYVVASVAGPVDGETFQGEKDTLIAGYHADGQRAWLTQAGSPMTDVAKGVALDPSGDPVMAGYTLADPAKQGEIFLTQFRTESGLSSWEARFGTPQFDTATALAYDTGGNLYVCGHSTGSLGGPSAGSFDVILIKYDANHVQQWARQLGSSDIDGSFGVTTDELGNVYVSAVSHSNLIDGTFEDDLVRDTFLLKFDAQGELLWLQRPSPHKDRETLAQTVIVGADGVYVAGWTDADLDGNSNRGGHDAFVLKYDFEGKLAWVRQYGTTGDDTVGQVVVDPSGMLYLVGTASGGLEGQPGAGGKDVFIMKLDPSGQQL